MTGRGSVIPGERRDTLHEGEDVDVLVDGLGRGLPGPMARVVLDEGDERAALLRVDLLDALVQLSDVLQAVQRRHSVVLIGRHHHHGREVLGDLVGDVVEGVGDGGG